MFLLNISDDGTTAFQWRDANAIYEVITSYKFVFILLLMKEIMPITDLLCQSLQSQSQDIFNSIYLVSSTKRCIQDLRGEG